MFCILQTIFTNEKNTRYVPFGTYRGFFIHYMFSVKSEVHNFIVFKSNDNIICFVILNDFCLRITLKLNIC